MKTPFSRSHETQIANHNVLQHPIVRTLLFERFLLTASATLAFAAVAMGRVRISEIPRLMDLLPRSFLRIFLPVSTLFLAILAALAALRLRLPRR
jgi:hypothetical protein